MITVAIDPGKLGAIVVIPHGYPEYDIIKYEMPLIGKELDINKLCAILYSGAKDRHVFIEDVHAIYGAAAGATFTFGFICGVIRGVVEAQRIPYTLVQPKKWQAEMFQGVPEIRKPNIIVKSGKFAGQSRKGARDTKKMALLAAKRLFPDVDLRKNTRCKIAHDGIVDALLIAEYGRRVLK